MDAMWDENQDLAIAMLVRGRVQVWPRAPAWVSRPMAGMPVGYRPWRRVQERVEAVQWTKVECLNVKGIGKSLVSLGRVFFFCQSLGTVSEKTVPDDRPRLRHSHSFSFPTPRGSVPFYLLKNSCGVEDLLGHPETPSDGVA